MRTDWEGGGSVKDILSRSGFGMLEVIFLCMYDVKIKQEGKLVNDNENITRK